MLNIPGHKEMQIKTMLRFHLTPVKITIIKKTYMHIMYLDQIHPIYITLLTPPFPLPY
jgi:hypothetical protein